MSKITNQNFQTYVYTQKKQAILIKLANNLDAFTKKIDSFSYVLSLKDKIN